MRVIQVCSECGSPNCKLIERTILEVGDKVDIIPDGTIPASVFTIVKIYNDYKLIEPKYKITDGENTTYATRSELTFHP